MTIAKLEAWQNDRLVEVHRIELPRPAPDIIRYQGKFFVAYAPDFGPDPGAIYRQRSFLDLDD